MALKQGYEIGCGIEFNQWIFMDPRRELYHNKLSDNGLIDYHNYNG